MEILGLLDTLESVIVESFKLPLSSKIVVDEDKLLHLVDKMRLLIQSGKDFAKKNIEKERQVKKETAVSLEENLSEKELYQKTHEVLEDAYNLASEIRKGADRYADEVLANLELTSSKILRTIRNGRLSISKIEGEKESHE